MSASSEPSRGELPTRLVLGSTMLASIGALYWFDSTRSGGLLTAIALGLVALAGIHEYVAMLRAAGRPIDAAPVYLAAALLCATPVLARGGGAAETQPYALVLATLCVLLLTGLRALARERMPDGLHAQGAALLGFVWIAWPMFVAQALARHHLPSVLYVVLICKVGDIGAYFAGTAFGRRKLIPHVSKGKTVEGALGSIVASCAVAVALRGPLGPPGAGLGLTTALAVGIMLNICAQVGDLTESMLKRSCGVKNSSGLLPAHGGILDLIDSLLLSFPAYYLIHHMHLTSPS